jgi:DNA-binding CsgD family transcriptional regulator
MCEEPAFQAVPDHVWRPVLIAVRAEADSAAREARTSSQDTDQTAHLARLRDAAAWSRPAGPVGSAFDAQIAAELRRAAGELDVPSWQRAVDGWERVGFEPDLAWARLRLAESLVATHDREAARLVASVTLDAAVALRAGPLVEQVLALSRRARLGLGPAADRASRDGPSVLTEREREVLELVAEGQSNDQIAGTLFISPKTASVHVSHILAKLGVSSRTEAAARWHEHAH